MVLNICLPFRQDTCIKFIIVRELSEPSAAKRTSTCETNSAATPCCAARIISRARQRPEAFPTWRSHLPARPFPFSFSISVLRPAVYNRMISTDSLSDCHFPHSHPTKLFSQLLFRGKHIFSRIHGRSLKYTTCPSKHKEQCRCVVCERTPEEAGLSQVYLYFLFNCSSMVTCCLFLQHLFASDFFVFYFHFTDPHSGNNKVWNWVTSNFCCL